MNSLEKLVIIGAGLGYTRDIASLFPIPKPKKTVTEADLDRIIAAQAKRDRKAAVRK